jgi:hypothetical protein
MRIRIRTKWLGEAKFNLTDRKYSKTRASAYIKNMAAREARRNAKAITNWETMEELLWVN